jgi:branched-chain amino acid transport system substrate-binding protein
MGAKKLIQGDNVVAILGPLLSREILAISPLAMEYELPIIVNYILDTKIVEENQWILTISLPRNKILKQGIAQWKNYSNVKRVAIIFDKSHGNTFTESSLLIPAILKDENIKLVGQASFFGRVSDFTHQVSAIIKSKPDGLIVNAYPIETTNIVRQFTAYGFRSPIFTASAPFPQIDASYFAETDNVNFCSTFWASKNNPNTIKFVKNMEKIKSVGFIEPSTADIYDAVYAIKEIFKKRRIRPEEISKVRMRIKDGWTELREIPGVSGLFSIDSNGEVIREVHLITVIKGKYKLVE